MSIIIERPLTSNAEKALSEEITQKAEQLVKELVARKRFCAVADLAVSLPVDIVATAVGLPTEGRERMLIWGDQMFNCFGPLNDRSRNVFPVLEEMMDYATTQAVRGKLKPGSWAEAIIDATGRGDIDRAFSPAIMIHYMGPSLDTTISAIGSGVLPFATPHE